jgi:hypothetical protein
MGPGQAQSDGQEPVYQTGGRRGQGVQCKPGPKTQGIATPCGNKADAGLRRLDKAAQKGDAKAAEGAGQTPRKARPLLTGDGNRRNAVPFAPGADTISASSNGSITHRG